jgi:uracil-DNA glycosylase family 4
MSDDYQQLLDSTIAHLQSLKERGVRFVSVAPESLELLNQSPTTRPTTRSQTPSSSPARTPVPASRPAAPAAPTVQAPRPVTPVVLSTASVDPVPAAPANPAKAAAFEALRQRVLSCVKCPDLVAARKSVVFGVGNLEAELMFVGEAPGADEDEQGEPFVGKAGQLLTKIIQTMGLGRDTVYIANILKCRPDTPGQSAGNRKPTADEMQTCIPYLHEQIDLIKPKVLVALGATAVEGLLGKTAGITKLRGNWQTYRGIPLMPTYHPAYLLRNQSLSEKRRVWEDMLQVMQQLGMPISDKQKNFFLKSA